MNTDISRRALLSALGSASMATALGGWSGLAQAHCKTKRFVWRNWSGAQECIPAARPSPASEEALAELLRQAVAPIRPVGSGHSFSPLVPTSGSLLSIGQLAGLMNFDAETMQAEFGAGTILSQVGDPLKERGLALSNMPDIAYQTLGGMLATSTHGTGLNHGSMATQVVGLRLVTPKGDIRDCSPTQNPALFRAAQVSLGALGVVSRYRFQCREAFRVKEQNWIARTEDLLDDLEKLTRTHEFFEFIPLLHTDYSLVIAIDETQDPVYHSGKSGEDEGNFFMNLIEKTHKYGSDFPAARRAFMNLLARQADFEHTVDDSYKLLSNVRNIRFNEMEYQVPIEAGPACLREILDLIKRKNLLSWFPLEYRVVKGDDITLSMFQGRDSASISIHQHYTMDYHHYFAEIEPIFWKYEGRPHWGKLHNLNARQLAPLYPHWQEFLDIRAELDPRGKMLNGHLRTVFGIA
ncbi:MAG: D-arabinono-1,4-lactone oxidase [Oceanococcaceae bacterium]